MNSFHTIDFKEGLNLIVGIQKAQIQETPITVLENH
jgi:hypothetical protein